MVVQGSSRLLHLVPDPFSGVGGGVKPQKPGEPHPVPMSQSPFAGSPGLPLLPLSFFLGFGNGNGMGVGAQPGEGAWSKLGHVRD